ncbi:unnamed protein product [Periconia digitata]|uniref:DUF7730 domain-containing protein n=1 Tax=Periconia digitata TaxID=1303443 RepID=A0A9W4XJD0_9PLEO|nr:unnamed protein product [Periconia digitata]
MPPIRTEPKAKRSRGTILTKKIANRSEQAKIYARNAAESPLLRLPAEIRLMIWKYALGGNTIMMNFTARHHNLSFSADEEGGFFPPGRFSCLTFPDRISPFLKSSVGKASKGFTLLNNVCRQLYKETALLPYELNSWACNDDKFFLRYVREKRLLPDQRRAIKRYHTTRECYRSFLNEAFLRLKTKDRKIVYSYSWGLTAERSSMELYTVQCRPTPIWTLTDTRHLKRERIQYYRH